MIRPIPRLESELGVLVGLWLDLGRKIRLGSALY